MRKSNKIVIILISIIVVLMVAAACLGYLYFKTDLFLTNKQLFMKYSKQLLMTEEETNKIKNYYAKKSNTPYTNSGKLQFDNDMDDEDMKKLVEAGNEVSIDFEGKTDNVGKQREQKITLNYSKDVNFPVTIRQDGDKFAAQTDYLASAFIGIENKDLKELFKKFGVTDTEYIPDKIDFEELKTIKFTPEEKLALKEKYGKVIDDQIKENQFSKEENSEGTVYVVEIKVEQLKSIARQCLVVLKDDEIMLSKINEALEKSGEEETIDSEDIEKLIEEFDDAMAEEDEEESDDIEIDEDEEDVNEVEEDSDLNSNVDNDKQDNKNYNIKIKLYQKNKVLDRIQIGNDVFTLKLKKDNQSDSIKYTAEAEVRVDTNTNNDEQTFDAYSINMGVQYTGLDTLDSITSSYELGVTLASDEEDEGFSFNYLLNNNVKFQDSVTIDELNDDNSVILNNESEEFIAQLYEAASNKLLQVYNEQMEQVGTDDNPILYTNPITIYYVSMLRSFYNNSSDDIGRTSEELDSENEENAEVDSSEIETFNKKFTKYEGTISSSEAKELYKLVDKNNSDSDSRLIDIEGSAADIKASEDYEVTIEYDSDGYVNEIIVKKAN